jgi:hypothetical protein
MQLLDDDTVLEVNRDVTRLNELLADLRSVAANRRSHPGA